QPGKTMARGGNEFLERLEFPRTPSGIIKEFVEDDDGPWRYSIPEQLQDGFGGGIEIAVDVQEGRPASEPRQQRRQGFVEPALDQLGMGRDFGQAAETKTALFNPGAPPLGEPLEGIETVNLLRSQGADEIDGGAAPDAEFADQISGPYLGCLPG